MVQGHTHVPAAVPRVYYNLGTWIASLVAPHGKEAVVETFPFLLTYADPAGQRVEEYFVARRDSASAAPGVSLQTQDSVNDLRHLFGYAHLKS